MCSYISICSTLPCIVSQRLKKYFPEDELDKHKDDIDTHIADKFWTNAVNATEYQYIRHLYERMEDEKDNVKMEVRTQMY